MVILRRWTRSWAAGALVAVYALAVLVPSLAFSFDHDVSIVHSLTEGHGGLLIPHFHHDDADQQKSDHKVPGGVHHCCGSLSLPGLLPPLEIAVVDRVCVALLSFLREDRHPGCGPGRLDRPPRLSSLI